MRAVHWPTPVGLAVRSSMSSSADFFFFFPLFHKSQAVRFIFDLGQVCFVVNVTHTQEKGEPKEEKRRTTALSGNASETAQLNRAEQSAIYGSSKRSNK